MTKKPLPPEWAEVDKNKRWIWSYWEILRCDGGGYLLLTERVNYRGNFGLFKTLKEAQDQALDDYRRMPDCW